MRRRRPRDAARTTCSSPATALTASRSRAASPEAVMAELFGRRTAARTAAAARCTCSTSSAATRRLGHRRRPAAARDRPRARARPPGQAAGGRVRARRRRGEHGRLARVAQPRRAVGAADRLPRRQQRATAWARRSSAPRPSPSCTSARAPTACTGRRSTATTSRPSSRPPARLLGRAREEREPSVLEAMTYRYRGHSVADAGLAYRTKEEIDERQERDPLLRSAAPQLREAGASRRSCARSTSAWRSGSQAASSSRSRAPSPTSTELAWGMYAEGADEQFARMRPGSPFGRSSRSTADWASEHADGGVSDRQAPSGWT